MIGILEVGKRKLGDGSTEMSAPGMVRVFQPANATELGLIHAALGAAEIAFLVENENYFFAGGGGFWSRADTPVWIQVSEEDAERARSTIRDAVGR